MVDDLVIEVRELRKDHGSFPAVRAISFEVRRGQVFALLGTNGAGKTTTMDVLAGFQAPTAGTVRVLGCDPRSERETIAPRVGVMLQEAGFFDGLSAAETVDAWRRFTPGARPRDEALDMVGLTDRIGTPVGRMSGGERRRLDLALALLGRPEVLFLDEPTTGLDPEARRRTWELLRELTVDGMAVLLTTHYMEEAEVLADHVAIMDRGIVVRAGTLEEIRDGAASVVSFRLPPALATADLPTFPNTRAACEAGRVHLTTPTPQRTLLALLNWADAHNVALDDMAVTAGSLEEIFLEIAAAGRETR
jgi:ABC-2 type transport system ATP-binding protein